MVPRSFFVWLQCLILAMPVLCGWAVEPPIERTVVAVPNGEFPEVDFGKVCAGDTLILNVEAPSCYAITSGDCMGGGDSPWTKISSTKFTAFLKDTYRGLHNGTFNGTMEYTCGGSGGSGGSANPPPITWMGKAKADVKNLTSETISTVPANRARTKIGVCEEVEVRAGESVTWSVTGGATLDRTIGSETVLTAGKLASTAVVTATFDGGHQCDITFTIVPPDGLALQATGPTLHEQNRASSGFLADVITVQPTDVSFYGTRIGEGPAPGGTPVPAITTGIFAAANGSPHNPGNSLRVRENNTAIGVGDRIYIFGPVGVQGLGTWLWQIPQLYECIDEDVPTIEYTSLDELGISNAQGDMTVSKGGESRTALFGDPTQQ
jgi:hypothetical protein